MRFSKDFGSSNNFPSEFVDYDVVSIQFPDYTLEFKTLGCRYEHEEWDINISEEEYSDLDSEEQSEYFFCGWEEKITIIKNGIVEYEETYIQGEMDSCKYTFLEKYEMMCHMHGLSVYPYLEEA